MAFAMKVSQVGSVMSWATSALSLSRIVTSNLSDCLSPVRSVLLLSGTTSS